MVYEGRDTLSLLFGAFSVQSEMYIDRPYELALGYTQTMMGFLLFNPAPKRIGMIGLGGGSLAKFCHRHLPDTTIAVAEIDPNVIDLRDQFHIPDDCERFQVHCRDGADFVQETENEFDVLIIDGFDKNGQPPELCSDHFYRNCWQALAPDGIAIMNVVDDVGEAQVILDRINRAFNHAVIVVDALDSENQIVFACKGSLLDLDEDVLLGRIKRLEMMHPVVLHITVQNLMQQRKRRVPLRIWGKR